MLKHTTKARKRGRLCPCTRHRTSKHTANKGPHATRHDPPLNVDGFEDLDDLLQALALDGVQANISSPAMNARQKNKALEEQKQKQKQQQKQKQHQEDQQPLQQQQQQEEQQQDLLHKDGRATITVADAQLSITDYIQRTRKLLDMELEAQIKQHNQRAARSAAAAGTSTDVLFQLADVEEGLFGRTLLTLVANDGFRPGAAVDDAPLLPRHHKIKPRELVTILHGKEQTAPAIRPSNCIGHRVPRARQVDRRGLRRRRAR